MKRTLIISLLLLACGLPASATYAFVNQHGCATTSAASCTMTQSLTSGNLVIAEARDGNSVTLNNPPFTDTASNTWTCAAEVDSTAASFTRLVVCWTIANSTASDTVTCTASGNLNLQCQINEYSGVPGGCTASNISDGNNTGANSTGTSVTTGSITTTDTDLLVAAAGTGSNETFTNGGTSVIFGSASTLRGTQTRVALWDRLNIASGTGSATTAGNASADWAALIHAFHGTSCPSGAVRHKSVQN